MKTQVAVLLFAFLGIAFTRPSGAGQRVAGKLNVHLVPHTHDDVGWLKTVDQYYYGANNSIQNAGVQYILDSVFQELKQNPNRKFIYVEQAFFQRWWDEQNERTKEEMKKLVKDGQFEFINGGWCMHDEASTHYVAMVDQTTLGHRRIMEQFGVAPQVGWQIDPFGHSATQASLLSARVGFTGLFFARIDYQDSQRRNKDRDYEFFWRPSPSLGVRGQIFTGAFERNGYGPPPGFNWDINSHDAPIQDDPTLEDYNVESRVNDFVKVVMDQFSANQGDDIMLTMGTDFQYSAAHTWFKNLDKLIDYVNKDGRVNVFYSTPSIYVNAKMSSNIQWTLKTDDFFPYADCPHCYWTGYFTSRTTLKRYVRTQSAYLNLARQLEVFSGTSGATRQLDEAVGVAQHHDAVSGTSKQHVAYDYARQLAKGHAKAAQFVNQYFSQLVGGDHPTFVECQLLNETICDATAGHDSFVMVAYNSLARARVEVVRLPVQGAKYEVRDQKGNLIPSQVAPSFTPFVKSQPNVLYFEVTVPGLGWTTYFVERVNTGPAPRVQYHQSAADVVIGSPAISVTFSGTDGRLKEIKNLKTGVASSVSHDFLWYAGYSHPSEQNSGAYIFRPQSNTATPACPGVTSLTTVRGPVVNEIRAVYCDWLAVTARLNGDDPFVEFEYQINSVPIGDKVGKEVISRFTTDIDSKELFYTDSNGRDFQERRLNYRPTWNLTVNEPVAGNYYPVNAACYIKDAKKQFSVLTDRSLGGASILNASLELMIQRRLLVDDGRGVGEPLNETQGITPYPEHRRLGEGIRVIGSQHLSLEPTSLPPSQRVRALQSRLFQPLQLAFTPLQPGQYAQWIASHNVGGSHIANDLPINLDLMTLQATESHEIILRLSHQFGVGEDPVLSTPTTIDLQKIFSDLPLTDIREVSLTTNRDVGVDAQDVVTIEPMDVRTFIFRPKK